MTIEKGLLGEKTEKIALEERNVTITTNIQSSGLYHSISPSKNLRTTFLNIFFNAFLWGVEWELSVLLHEILPILFFLAILNKSWEVWLGLVCQSVSMDQNVRQWSLLL